jgi:hypothetical protein
LLIKKTLHDLRKLIAKSKFRSEVCENEKQKAAQCGYQLWCCKQRTIIDDNAFVVFYELANGKKVRRNATFVVH